MALDTAVKRNSALNITIPWRSLPLPTGTVSSGERLGLLYLYEFPRFVVMTCDAGSYAWTGVDADLFFNHVLFADPGSYSWSGVDADLLANRVLAADPGSYVWTGYDADLGKMLILVCDPGSYAWTGAEASLYIVGFNNDTFSYQLIPLKQNQTSGGDFEFQGMTVKKPQPSTGADFEYQKV
jgi:hypothetical protein